ncbi:MAG: diacylglycerol kinase family protein [Phascolarctobacterium sp.]|nr:diacylglycerol kinase family protein [Phascolarctobacterium sp.]
MPNKHIDIHEFHKVVLIYNRNSGKQIFSSMFARINEVFRLLKLELGTKVVTMLQITRFDELDGTVDHIVDVKADWVIIAGGDGTIRAAIEKIYARGCKPYISVFPAGTVNLVAKELNMNIEPHRWFFRVIKGLVIPVYMGRANGNSFITVASMGFDSLVVDNVNEHTKKILNKLAYVLKGGALIRKEMLLKNWQYEFKIRFDDEEKTYTAASIIVGKSRYYAGRYNLFRGANLSEPVFHIALFEGNTKVQFARYASLIALEAINTDPSITIKQAHKLEITCNEENFPVELDGDSITATPLVIEMDSEPIKFLG